MLIGGRAHSLEDVEFIAAAGFPFVEISIRSIPEFQSHVPCLKRIQDEHQLFYLAHGPEENDPWGVQALREQFLPLIKALLGCAAELAIPLFTLHFWIDHRFVNEAVVKEKVKMLQDVSACAKEHAIVLCLENLSETCCDFSPAFAASADLRMTLDIGHGQLLTANNTSYDFITRFFPRICHVHIHDNRGGDSPQDDLHLPLGEGVVDIRSILGSLKAQGYNQTMTLEVQPSQLLSGKNFIEHIWHEPSVSATGTTV